MRWHPHVWSLGALLIVVPLVHPATGASAPDGEVDPEWASMRRAIDVRFDSRTFMVTTGDLENGTDIQRYTYDARSATLAWSLQNATTEDDDAVPPVNGTLRFNGILEYEDIDGDQRLSLIDNVERNVRSGDLLFPRITTREPQPGQHRVDVRYVMPDLQRGTVNLRFTFTETTTPAGNDTLWPSEAHLAIDIDRYMYRRANQTQLAVDLRITGDPDLHGSALFLDGRDRYRPHIHWNQTALIDDALRPVGSTIEHTSGHADDPDSHTPQTLLALSYPRAATIEHHIQIGHTHSLAESTLATIGGRILGEWRVFTLGLILAAILVGGAAYPHIRSRL